LSRKISGIQFKDAVISGAANITSKCREVNELNVFPVPDGDTGTNMSMTINAASRHMKNSKSTTLDKLSVETASALLRGARGNSGVILSLLYRGISKGFKSVEEADGEAVAKALTAGVEAAYGAVMKPTEGTILTVARVAAEKATALAKNDDDAVNVFEAAYNGACEALAETPEMLPVLKKAGVVDAGGQGLVLIFEGMLSVFRDGTVMTAGDGAEAAAESKEAVAPSTEGFNEDIKFAYCTEFIVNRNPECKTSPLSLRAFLESIGDCVVVVDDEEIIKVHVHTNNPGKAIEEGIKFGSLVNIKIDNMKDQNEKIQHEQKAAEENEFVPAKPEKKYGFVAVAAGDGICSLFSDLGVDSVVKGGQTMNPSTDDILRAVEETPAEVVFVLPNNKNIIMAAEQTIPLATRRVCVLPTRSIPMGISAMLTFDEDAEVEENLIEMNKAADRTGTGLITYAARNSSFEGKEIKEGEILALKNGKINFVEQDIVKAAVKLTKALVNKDTVQITLFYGEGVDEELANKVNDAVEAKCGDIQVTTIEGGQPVYYFIISVE